MKLKTVLMDEKAIRRTLTRISHEIVEKNNGVDDVVLVGIKRRGVPLAERIRDQIENIEGKRIEVCKVDITFYRDDLSMIYQQPEIKNKSLNFNVKDKKVIIVDDVIYTGRTARAAIDAVISNGRPKMIELAELIDRGHRELPIRPDFVGKNVPTSKDEMISVGVKEIDGNDSVKIYEL